LGNSTTIAQFSIAKTMPYIQMKQAFW